MTDLNDIAEARAAAEARKTDLLDSVNFLKFSLSPPELKRRATYEAKQFGRAAAQKTTATVRDHPFAVASLGAATLLFLFRKPITRWIDDHWQPMGDWVVEEDEWVPAEEVHLVSAEPGQEDLIYKYAGQGNDPDKLEEDDNR